MTDNLRQRRGKKASSRTAAAAATAAPQASSETNTGDNGDEQTPIDQLRSAEARLIVSRDRTADLHTAWRSQMFLMSMLMVCVAIHQLQSSISACIGEIKGPNNEPTISGAEATKIILGDSFCEIMGVIIASLLAYFLALSQIQKLELDHWPYMLSSAFVPVCLGFHFNSQSIGCVGENNELGDDSAKESRHQFPVIVIYHTIVTLAYWFMKSGMQACEDHVKLVTDSIQDFERMEKKMELKKKLKGQKARMKK